MAEAEVSGTSIPPDLVVGLRDALRAEWTKLRTAPGMIWLLFAVLALTVLVSVLADAAVNCPSEGCGLDPAKISLAGIVLGQAVVAVLAVLAVGGEYSTGMTYLTFTAMPRRLVVLTARSVVLTGLVLLAAIPAVLMSLLIGRLILPGHGFTAAHGYPVLSLGTGVILRAAVGSILYLVLVGLLSLGVGTAVRDSAAGIGIVLGLLYVVPIFGQAVSDPDWRRHLQQLAPMSAGLAVQASTNLSALPIRPWLGLGVLAGWAAASLLVAAALLHIRDA